MKSDRSESPKEDKKEKVDYSIKHSVSADKMKLGDTSNKIEVQIPELQMSFFVSKDATQKEIEAKKQSYLNRSGAYLVFKAREE